MPDVTPHPKPGTARTIIDPQAVKLAALSDRECAACGGPGANGHHVLPRDRGGDDLAENIVSLCGSGTMGCHGAAHGNPHMAVIPPGGYYVGQRVSALTLRHERRDAAWVNQRIGATLVSRRQDVIAYIVGKLGPLAAAHFLRDTYAIRQDDDGEWRQAPEAAPLVHSGGCCELAR